MKNSSLIVTDSNERSIEILEKMGYEVKKICLDSISEHEKQLERILILPIKKRWFDMILSGEKKEEYREMKPYWETRFRKYFGDSENMTDKQSVEIVKKVLFRNGYGNDKPCFTAECSLRTGTGKKEWGAESGKKYYILEIKRIIKRKDA